MYMSNWTKFLNEKGICSPDAVGNMPCDNGCICDRCSADWIAKEYSEWKLQNNVTVYCKHCGKPAEKHKEAISHAKAEGITPSQWVRKHERLTRDDKYYDTHCYIKAGMPSF